MEERLVLCLHWLVNCKLIDQSPDQSKQRANRSHQWCAHPFWMVIRSLHNVCPTRWLGLLPKPPDFSWCSVLSKVGIGISRGRAHPNQVHLSFMAFQNKVNLPLLGKKVSYQIRKSIIFLPFPLPSFLIQITVHLLTKNLFLLAWLRVVLRKEKGYRLTTGFLHWLTDRLATNRATKRKLASLIALLSSLLVLSRFLPYPTKQAWIWKSAFWIVSMGRQRKTLICFWILGCCWSHTSMPNKSTFSLSLK